MVFRVLFFDWHHRLLPLFVFFLHLILAFICVVVLVVIFVFCFIPFSAEEQHDRAGGQDGQGRQRCQPPKWAHPHSLRVRDLVRLQFVAFAKRVRVGGSLVATNASGNYGLCVNRDSSPLTLNGSIFPLCFLCFSSALLFSVPRHSLHVHSIKALYCFCVVLDHLLSAALVALVGLWLDT